jgi:hypothetical protein
MRTASDASPANGSSVSAHARSTNRPHALSRRRTATDVNATYCFAQLCDQPAARPRAFADDGKPGARRDALRRQRQQLRAAGDTRAGFRPPR